MPDNQPDSPELKLKIETEPMGPEKGPDLEQKGRSAETILLLDKDDHAIEEELQRATLEIPRPSIRPAQKSATQVNIENILAEDLKDVYLKMPLQDKAKFKRVGEETASSIDKLIREAKFKITLVLDLIKKWLMLIPAVNKFFLEQEAKIKTDQIIKLRDDLKNRGQI